MTSHPNMEKIRIIGFFFENKLHWQFEFRLLLFTVGDRGGTVVKVAGSIPPGVMGIFH